MESSILYDEKSGCVKKTLRKADRRHVEQNDSQSGSRLSEDATDEKHRDGDNVRMVKKLHLTSLDF